jgi:hypothetical protein
MFKTFSKVIYDIHEVCIVMRGELTRTAAYIEGTLGSEAYPSIDDCHASRLNGRYITLQTMKIQGEIRQKPE